MPETHPSDDATENGDEPDDGQLPRETVERAERLTRLAREAVDDDEADAYREERSELLADHEFRARVREEDTGETLVLHPDEWVEDGMIRTERIEDTDRAVEVSLSGPGDPDEWESVEEHNRDIAARVRSAHGEVHGDNAAAFADFMGNHYARPVESATGGEVEEFLSEYFPRNAWPTEEQRAVVEESIDLVFEVADE
ncbi:rnhA operon protein [Halorussus limi]|uniref:RnhA operon protein n=1 Tax=Halorussus limi TaxID=2938695 RepID=A0A8U0HR01_9EURY|nr:rnhA operon protein [Halorussus limi]UPV73327.1 rnhA operon protein [Halorussus limi]